MPESKHTQHRPRFVADGIHYQILVGESAVGYAYRKRGGWWGWSSGSHAGGWCRSRKEAAAKAVDAWTRDHD